MGGSEVKQMKPPLDPPVVTARAEKEEEMKTGTRRGSTGSLTSSRTAGAAMGEVWRRTR